MRILALDTSGEWCSVAVGDGAAWCIREERTGQENSERVLPLVQAVLAEAGATLAALDGLAFSAGPGSFTGIRLGCGVVQGLALGAELPVIAVPTLGALAEAAHDRHGWTHVIACLDARMREVYVAAYAREGTGWRTIADAAVIPPADVVPPSGSNWAGAGNGFAAYGDLARRLALAAVDADVRPSARYVGDLALPRLAAGEGVAARAALPLYVRHRVALTTAERDAGQRL
jgi:tRNA threonylcarbamoyladenosine biosynthesis protein TsaB